VSSEAWREDAACSKYPTDWWFAEGTGREAQIQRAFASRICAACPVKDECLAWATENQPRFGMWGGLSQRALMKLRDQPTVPDDRHTVRVVCGCGKVFYRVASQPRKHCSGRCLDVSRAAASKLSARRREMDALNRKFGVPFTPAERARRSRARKREAAFPTEKPGVFPLDSGAGVVFSGSDHEDRSAG
jgi:hypothetical protein